MDDSSGTSSVSPSSPTTSGESVSCLAWTSRPTSRAWVPSPVTVRLAKTSRKPREDRHGVRSGHSPRWGVSSPAGGSPSAPS